MNLVVLMDREFFNRALKGGSQPEFVPSLSLIKFPSPNWKMYALTNFPQEKMAEKLFEDPYQLHREILTKIAVKSALHAQESRSKLRKKISILLDLYGKERWPVSIWMNRRIKKIIKNNQLQRGLAKNDP